MGSRTWIKIYCDKWLEGTLREEPPEFRGIWTDVLALAGNMNYGDTGEIKLNNNIGLTDDLIAQILHIKLAIWRKFKQKFIKTGRIKVSKSNVIKVINWKVYQSEYQRQKGYRQNKEKNNCNERLQLGVTPEIEKEKEIEKDNQQADFSYDQLKEKTDRVCKSLNSHFRKQKFNAFMWRQKFMNGKFPPNVIELLFNALWQYRAGTKNPVAYLAHIFQVESQNYNERQEIEKHKKTKKEELAYDRSNP